MEADYCENTFITEQSPEYIIDENLSSERIDRLIEEKNIFSVIEFEKEKIKKDKILLDIQLGHVTMLERLENEERRKREKVEKDLLDSKVRREELMEKIRKNSINHCIK